MAVTAALVKELREISGAGMVDCKNALVATDGDLEKAIEILREKGLSAAAKKAGRIATEGLVYAYITDDNKKGVLVEVNSETDFVAKNQEFKNYVHAVALQVAQSQAQTIEELLDEKWIDDQSVTVKEALSQKIAVIGENLNIRRFERFEIQEEGAIVSYIHGGGKVAVMLKMASSVAVDKLTEAGKNVCMQIAAMSPRFIDKADVPQEFIEKEKEILTQQALNEGKPANIVEKMIIGRLNKELKDFCLLEQEYVKDAELTVSGYLKAFGSENGGEISVKQFVRYETGEGLEKKEENFADEVNKAMNK